MEIGRRAHLYLVASLIIGSFTPVLLVLTKVANSLELFMIASLLSIPVGLLLLAKNEKIGELKGLLYNKRKLFFIAVAAILAYVPYEYGIAYAEHFISASLATVIFRLNPLLMLIFLPFLLRERLSKKQVGALGLAFVGVVVGLSGGNPLGLFSNADLPILAFVLLLALGYALSTVIIKREMVDNDLYLSASTFILTIFYAGFFFGSGAHFAPLAATDIVIILYLAITNIFSFYMFIHALKVLKTTVVTNVYLASPFLTFVWAYLMFGSPIQVYYLVIALLTCIGIVIQHTDKIGGSYLTRTKGGPSHRFTIFDVTGAFAGDGSGGVREIVREGGRVFATKVYKDHAHHITSIMDSGQFQNVYTGEEAFITDETKFVKDVLGVERDEAMVIKAGSSWENDRFFEELGKKIRTPE